MVEGVVLRVPIITFDPNTTYIVVEMENKPGVLASVLRILSEANVNVLEGVHSRGVREDRGHWLAVIEAISENVLRDLSGKLRSVDGVLNVSIGVEHYGRARMPFILEWSFMFVYVFDGHSRVHHGLS